MELTESSRSMRGARKVKMNTSWSCVPNFSRLRRVCIRNHCKGIAIWPYLL